MENKTKARIMKVRVYLEDKVLFFDRRKIRLGEGLIGADVGAVLNTPKVQILNLQYQEPDERQYDIIHKYSSSFAYMDAEILSKLLKKRNNINEVEISSSYIDKNISRLTLSGRFDTIIYVGKKR